MKRLYSFFFFFCFFLIFSNTTIYSESWEQTDWSGGSGQNEWSDSTKFQSETNIDYQTAGEIKLEVESWPQPSADTQEATFPAENSEAVGVLATDGTYFYTKSWSSYDGNDRVVSIIGTGYNGTTAGKDYGDLALVHSSISGFYLNGYFYNGYTSNGRNLERVNVSTGEISFTPDFSEPLMNRGSGSDLTGAYGALLVTTDGTYIYNVAYSQGSGYNGWRVKVFDPVTFNLVRKFDSGTSSYYTDGIFADGTHIYYIQWSNSNNAHITRASATDGTIKAVWTINQGTTKVINGQYDWVNNKVWLGDLLGPDIYCYPGVEYFSSGELISSYYNTGGTKNFQYIYLDGDKKINETDYKVQIRTAPDNAGSPGTWTDWLGPTGTGDYYEGGKPSGEEVNSVHNGHQWIQYKVILSNNTGFEYCTPKFENFKIDFYPTSDNLPNTFTLLSPSDGQMLSDLTPTLSWEGNGDPDAGDTVTYYLWISKDSTFATKTEINVGSSTSYMISSDLDDNSTYYWKVKAVDSFGAIRWSDKTGYFYTNVANEAPSQPTAYSPQDGSNITDLTPTLVINNSTDPDPNETLTYEFEIYRDSGLTDLIERGTNVAEATPHTSWTVSNSLLYNRTYYWRVRAYDGETYGSWSPTFSFLLSNGWVQTDWSGGSGQEEWVDETKYNTSSNVDGSFSPGNLILTHSSLPQPSPSTQETTFPAQNSEAVGVLATDGTYLYTKSWSSYDENDRVVSIIGTGYNGTTAGKDYGDLAVVNSSISAFYLNGYFYNGYTSNGRNLERVNVVTGEKTFTPDFSDPLMNRATGNNLSGAYSALLVTTDGKYIYNVAYSQGSGYNGWKVKVFDPSDFSLIREFNSGSSSYYTDGVFADGTYIYYIQWSNSNSARITRASATDGTIKAVWTINQGTTKVINGQYDWVNNKVWLGDLMGPDIYRYTGFTYFLSGELESSVFDSGSASNFSQISWDSDTPSGTSIKFQLRTGNTKEQCLASDWTGPDGTSSSFYTESGQDISSSLNGKQWVQYKVFLETTSPYFTPTLYNVLISMFPVGENKPNTFNLLSPSKGTTVGSKNVTLSWEESGDPDEGDWVTYTIWYSTNSSFTTKTEISNISGTTYTITGLSEDTRYYWKVKAVDSYGAETWCNQTDWYFNVNSSNRKPTAPTVYYPSDGTTITLKNPSLRINNSSDEDPYDTLSYEFEIYSDSSLSNLVEKSGLIGEGTNGVTSYNVSTTLSYGSTYWWRARAYDGFDYGDWGGPWSFTVTKQGTWVQTDWSGGSGQDEWFDETMYYESADVDDSYEGEIKTEVASYPKPSPSTQETTFPAENSEAVGVLGTDGKYLYTKSWSGYDGNDRVVSIIGTGYNGTIAGKDYGDLALVHSSISGFYLNGYFYNGYTSNGRNLERVDVNTGVVSYTPNFGTALMSRSSGHELTGAYGALLVTTDGTYIYNVAYSQGSGYNGWRVKVFEPSDFSLVREFNSGTSSYYTDGILADGTYIYYIQWSNNNNARITRASAIDGTIKAVWTINQGTTKVINGQYDWVNNKVWLGDLLGPDIYRYSGKIFKTSGYLVSSAYDIGSTGFYNKIYWVSSEDTQHTIKFQLRGGNSDEFTLGDWTDWMGPDGTSSTYYTNSSGENIEKLDSFRWIQYKVFFENSDSDTSGILKEVSIDYEADDDETGPSFSNFYPQYVGEDESFYIEVTIYDKSGVYDDSTGSDGQGVYLIWDNDGNLYNGAKEVQMQSIGGNRFRTVTPIQGQKAGVNFVYKVYAYDNDFDNSNANDRTQSVSSEQRVIIGERSFSVEPESNNLIAGKTFSVVITAKILLDGKLVTDENYNGSVIISQNYILPSIGSYKISPQKASGFKKGVLKVNMSYDDCGDIKIEVKDSTNSKIAGYSDMVHFDPFSLSLEGGKTHNDYTFVNEPFDLTLKVKNYKGNVVSNFSEDIILSLVAVGDSSSNAKLNKSKITVFNGSSKLTDLRCDTYGTYKIKAEYAMKNTTLGNISAETDSIKFVEKGFSIDFSSPPPDRQFYYIGETFRVTVSALDYDGNKLETFSGGINIVLDGNIYQQYLFSSQDNGSHVFAVSIDSDGVKQFKIQDYQFSEISSESSSVEIKYGKIKVESKDVSVGTTQVEVSVLDKNGNVITEENSLSFRLTLKESNPNSSCVLQEEETDIPVSGGKAVITLTDNEAEEVVITPKSSPELDVEPGIINFGTIGDSGIRILYWREKK